MNEKTKERIFIVAPLAAGLGLAILFNAGLGLFGLRFVTVSGHSMDDTLHDGQHFFARTNEEIVSGDIVVCNSEGLGKDIIKRVIAVGGETIDIDFKKHTVTVNGSLLEEPYIKEPTAEDEGGFKYPITVPEGHYFVMGDNRNHSTDSRDARVGFVSSEDIIGKIKI